MTALPFSSPSVAFADLDPVRQQVVRDRARVLQDQARKTKEAALLALPALELELKRRACLGSLKTFVSTFWHVIEPDQDLVWNWHLDALCGELDLAERTPGYKGVYNVPPGTMKSLLVSVMFRAQLWAKNPSLRFLCGSYSDALSVRDNTKLRDIVASQSYRALFPKVVLSSEQNAKEHIATTLHGWSIATSVGGRGTGEHPDYVIVDDPLTAQQARSLVELRNASDWMDRTLSTRGIVRDKRSILIMQRLHELDCTGHVLAKGNWRHVYFPMRFIPEQRDVHGSVAYTPHPKDQRILTGESLLWPVLFPEHKVRALEIELNPYGTAGQLQQRPVPEGGGLFKRSWFKFVDAPPAFARRARGWDTGATEGGGDDTVGVKISEAHGSFYIEDCIAVQLGPAGVDSHIKTTAEMDGRQVLIGEEQEPGSSGKTVIAARALGLAGYDYKGMPTSGDKVTRANPFRAQCEAGNVHLVRGPWNESWVTELEHFPVGAKDNRVDATSCAFNRLVLAPKKVTGATWGRRA